LPVYRHKDTLLHGLSPMTALLMIMTMAASALLLENPLYVALICAEVRPRLGYATCEHRSEDRYPQAQAANEPTQRPGPKIEPITSR